MPPHRSETSLSVIVPAYNRPDDLNTLLASLKPDLHRVEVIVVDDCSPDPKVYGSLQADYPGVRFLRQERNLGPAAARNRGAGEARGELLLFLDCDTAVLPGTIDAVLRVYRDHPDFVVCNGATDKEPINPGFFAAYKSLLQESWVQDRHGRVTYVNRIGGRVFTIRRSTMLQLGGFDESLPTADVEDYEFGYRIQKAYGPIPLCTEIRVRHRWGTLPNQAKLYYRRVILWWELRTRSPGADDLGSSTHEATVAILSTLMSMCLAAAFAVPLLLWPALLLTFAVSAINRRFLGLCMRERGLRFTLAAFGCHTFLSWFICAGATVALLRATSGRICHGLHPTRADRLAETSNVI